jgi:hypothetical protein
MIIGKHHTPTKTGVRIRLQNAGGVKPKSPSNIRIVPAVGVQVNHDTIRNRRRINHLAIEVFVELLAEFVYFHIRLQD